MTAKIVRFYPKEASDELWEKYFAYSEAIYNEENPRDILPSRNLEKSFMKEPASDYNIYRWLIFNEDQSRVIGHGNFWHENEKSPYYDNVKENIFAFIAILKDQRRKGLATTLLKEMVQYAKSIGKSNIRVQVSNDIAVSFCKASNGHLVTERALNRIYFDDVDWDFLDEWRTNSIARKQQFKLEIFGIAPQDSLDEFCQVYTEIFNLAPAEDSHGEVIISPEKRRADETLYHSKNINWITIIARDKNDKIVGLTEIYYHEETPDFIDQDLTGVLKEYQGKGLGKWLKAEMLFYIMEHFPKATFIQTGNNNNNAPMLSINNRMGFKVYKKETFFDFDIDVLLTKLGI